MSLVAFFKKIFEKKVEYSTTPFSNPFSHLQIVEQYVSEVVEFSTEYQGWPASNVIGPYNTYPQYGDIRTAWAPSTPKCSSSEKEYLIVKFKQFVLLDSLEIFETLTPGAIVKISYQNVFYPEQWNVVYFQSSPSTITTAKKSRIFSPPLQHYRTKREEKIVANQEDTLLNVLLTSPITNTLRIELDTSQNTSYSEIDAIKSIGYGIPNQQQVDSITQKNISALCELANYFTQNQITPSQEKVMQNVSLRNSKGVVCYQLFVHTAVLEKRCILVDCLTLPSDSLSLKELQMISTQLLHFVYLDQFIPNSTWNELVLKALFSFGNQLQAVKLVWMSQVCLFLVNHQHTNCITSSLLLALSDLYPSSLMYDLSGLSWNTFQFHDTSQHPFAQLLTTVDKSDEIEDAPFDFATTPFDMSSFALVDQWVNNVISASSEYQGWPASNIVGASNTYPNYGDIRTAWAPLPARNSQEFVEFEYKQVVLVKEMHIYETYNPGAVVKISVQDVLTGGWKVLYQGAMQQEHLPAQARIFKPSLNQGMLGKRFRIDMDTTKSASWSEIDAIKLVGYCFSIKENTKREEYLKFCSTKQDEEVVTHLQIVFENNTVSESPIKLHPFVMQYRLLHQSITTVPFIIKLEVAENLPREEVAKLVQCIQLFSYGLEEWFQTLLQFEYRSTFTALCNLAKQCQMHHLSAILCYVDSSLINSKVCDDWRDWITMFDMGINQDFKMAYNDTLQPNNSILEFIDIFWRNELLCKAHKSFLKHSNSFFDKLLSTEWNSLSNTNTVDLQLDEWSCTAAEIKIVIQYLYCKELIVPQLNASNAFPIYFCAKELLCDDLAFEATQIICKNITKQNIFEVMETCLNWNITELITFMLGLLQLWCWHEKTLLFLEQYIVKKEQEWVQWFYEEVLCNFPQMFHLLKEKQHIKLVNLSSEFIIQRNHTNDSSITTIISLSKPLELQYIALQYSNMNFNTSKVWCILYEESNRISIDKNVVLENLQQHLWKELACSDNATFSDIIDSVQLNIRTNQQRFTQYIKIEMNKESVVSSAQVMAVGGYRYQLHPSQKIVE